MARQNTQIGRKIPPVAIKTNRNYNKYEKEIEKKPFNFKFWFIFIGLLLSCYIFLNKVEEYFLENIYIQHKNSIPIKTLNVANDDNMEKIIKTLKSKDALPMYEDDVNVILLLVSSYGGNNLNKSTKIKSIVDSSITNENKKIQKRYFVLEIDNSLIMDDKNFKQEFPWNLLTKYKFHSILNYGKISKIEENINIYKFSQLLRNKYKNAIISINISNEIQDSVLAYNSLMELGALSKNNILVTVSSGNYETTDGFSEKLKDFKYYTIQRIAFKLLKEKIIDIRNFKISLNADKINANLRDNQKLYSDYNQMKVRNGGMNNTLNKQFIQKWIKEYPEMFYSDNSPMEYFLENKNMFEKEYEFESDFANPKINFDKTKFQLKEEIQKK